MRKTLKISALALALVMVLGMTMAFAAVSVTGPITVVDGENNPVSADADVILNANSLFNKALSMLLKIGISHPCGNLSVPCCDTR